MDVFYVVPFVLLCLVLNVNCSVTGDGLDKSNETLVGKALLDMGTLYNKPLLRLFGKSLMNLECKLVEQCGDWAEWSPCKLFIGQYGMKKRTRQCGGDALSEHCETELVMREEEEFEVCEESCPSSYKVIRDGFCLKFYSTHRTNADADDNCKTDGGHLININSEKKWEAFSSLTNYSNRCSYINGQRVDTSSPWRFTYEKNIMGYTKWGSGQPSNGSTELCMCANASTSYKAMFDATCTGVRSYVCEIVKHEQ